MFLFMKKALFLFSLVIEKPFSELNLMPVKREDDVKWKEIIMKVY